MVFAFYCIISFSCLLVILPVQTSAEYIATDVYPDTLEQCADFLVPIASATYPSSATSCINDENGGSKMVKCNDDFSFFLKLYSQKGCFEEFFISQESFLYSKNCSMTNSPVSNIRTPGIYYKKQTCVSSNPPEQRHADATMTVVEYANPSCNNGSPDKPMLVSTTTSYLNICQNTGGSLTNPGSSFLIQCNSTTAYISNYTGYGCLSSKLNTISPLFQLGCSTNFTSLSSISVTCSGGPTPSPSPPPPPSQPSNDIWRLITQGPYLIYSVSAGAGLVGGGFLVCFCVCLCRRRNRNKRYRRSFSSPTQYSTSVQSNGVISDGIGTPLRSDVLPGLGNNQGSPSQGGQSKQNVRTPLLSQSNEERGGFGNDDDDSEA